MLARLSKIHTLLIRVALSPPGQAFIFSLTCWLLAFTYCRYKFWREPHSAFFDGSDRQYEFKYSKFRTNQGLEYLDTLAKGTGTGSRKSSSDPEICAAFVTVKREGTQYIDAALGSMLEGLTDWERSQFELKVLFADPDPSIHPTWHQPWLNEAVDWAGTYNVTKDEHDRLAEMFNNHWWAEKGVLDYVYALNLCYKSVAPYILILEDDIIVADSWLAKTHQAIHTIEEKSQRNIDPFFKYLYLRLFFTETSLTWESNEDFIYRRMDLTFISGISTTAILLLIIRRLFTNTKPYLDTGTVLVLSLITTPAFVLLFFMIGKNIVIPVAGVSLMPQYGCCSQALLFPRQHVPGLSKWFHDWHDPNGRNKGYMSTDVMIDFYAEENGLSLLALRPQLVQHVGVKSSRNNLDINGRSTRAFWFEDYDPATLRREHDVLAAAWQ